MWALLIYILKSGLYLTLLYGFFWLAMRKAPFFHLNRWMLVMGTVVCMLLPFCPVSVEETGVVQMPVQSLSHWLEEAPETDSLRMEASTLPQETMEKENRALRSHPYLYIYGGNDG